MQSINPATGEVIADYSAHSQSHIILSLEKGHSCFLEWKETSFAARAEKMHKAASVLHARKKEFSHLMADEMGKPLKDGEAEIKKCAVACEYYADNAEHILADEPVKTNAQESFISYQPQGIILAIMPWNFPFWQVFRFAAPNLMAGNVGILKHASNVSGCALAIEEIFQEAGFPDGCFTTLLITSDTIPSLIEHKYIRAVTLTGSSAAGKSVAAKAGGCLKKTVLELGGSDAYVILEDADIEHAAKQCAESRLLNAGQSCICAKRFIILSSIKKVFEEKIIEYFTKVVVGHPQDGLTDIGPMARVDLRDALHKQVEQSIAKGAVLLLGGKIPQGGIGAFYPLTVLTNVKSGMPAFDEELFGPVAAIIEAKDETEAFELANQTQFGLGSAIFSKNVVRARELARTHLDAGQTFVNCFVQSDARLPFGGVKESGYGRELGSLGIKEFMNAKTVFIK
jgi:succinate-semialdehyde dehydrogenase/glutarate-semialdehyde dehydrogenase